MQDPLGKLLGFGAWNKSAGVRLELVFVEPDAAEQVLDRDPFPAFLQGFTQGQEVIFLEGTVKLRVKFHPSAAKLVGHEHLHVATSVVDPAFFKIAGAAIDGFKNSTHFRMSGGD